MAPPITIPLALLGVRNFLGGFWHLSKLKFEEILPKISRMQILGKLAPLLVPPVPLGYQNNFWEVSGIYLSSSLKKYHQKYQECRFCKDCPPCGPLITIPPDSPWSQKLFWDVSGIYLSSSLMKYHQKYHECRV